jgi:hypothetical protein
VFVVPEWTRNLLLARLGKVGRDLTLTPGRLACSSHLWYRQRANHHPHCAVEGPQGPARDAACGSPGAVAAMVEGAADRV